MFDDRVLAYVYVWFVFWFVFVFVFMFWVFLRFGFGSCLGLCWLRFVLESDLG